MLVLDEQIGRIEQRIIEWRRSDEACLRISEIPGRAAYGYRRRQSAR
jgi:transposase